MIDQLSNHGASLLVWKETCEEEIGKFLERLIGYLGYIKVNDQIINHKSSYVILHKNKEILCK